MQFFSVLNTSGPTENVSETKYYWSSPLQLDSWDTLSDSFETNRISWSFVLKIHKAIYAFLVFNFLPVYCIIGMVQPNLNAKLGSMCIFNWAKQKAAYRTLLNHETQCFWLTILVGSINHDSQCLVWAMVHPVLVRWKAPLALCCHHHVWLQDDVNEVIFHPLIHLFIFQYFWLGNEAQIGSSRALFSEKCSIAISSMMEYCTDGWSCKITGWFQLSIKQIVEGLSAPLVWWITI